MAHSLKKFFGAALVVSGIGLGLAPSFASPQALQGSSAPLAVPADGQRLLLGQVMGRGHQADVSPGVIGPDIQDSVVYALVILGTSLGAAGLGFRLQRSAPFSSFTDENRSAARSALGLATLLTAIVIGIVSDDAISTFDQVNTNIQSIAIDTLTLDKVLDSYGPETKAIREMLKDDLRSRIQQLKAPSKAPDVDLKEIEGLPRPELIFREIASLNPKNKVQGELRSRAMAMVGGTASFGTRGNLAQKRWLLAIGDANAPRPVYYLVIFSLALEFLCFGLLVKPHISASISTSLAALVVAGTMLVVVELDNPNQGFFTVWVEPLQKAERLLGR